MTLQTFIDRMSNRSIAAGLTLESFRILDLSVGGGAGPPVALPMTGPVRSGPVSLLFFRESPRRATLSDFEPAQESIS
jgi:hypothetical protein